MRCLLSLTAVLFHIPLGASMGKLFLLLGCLLLALQPSLSEARTIRDMRGVLVDVPEDPKRIATIDDGFIEGVMTHLGMMERICAIGSWGMKRDYRYTFIASDGETFEHKGLHTMRFLHPWLDSLPCVVPPQGGSIDFEHLASAKPDVVVLRLGDTAVGMDRKKAQRTIETIEALGLPLLVLHSPTWTRSSDLSSMKVEASILGELCDKKADAEAFAEGLAKTEDLIRARTSRIPEKARPSLLLLGLRPDIRRKGGAGTVHGIDTPESAVIEQIVNARNAWRGKGTAVPVSTEQIYACDPDVIILPTANGYHPPRELYEASYFRDLQELRAVKAGQVFALPWTPMNASRRVEYPIEMLIMAKAAYPQYFADVSIHEFALDFYRAAYGVDDDTARGLLRAQMLDWMEEKGF